ncbi:hypothetical protein BH11BAC6_BH11BAC6_12110 [soil metagenome]
MERVGTLIKRLLELYETRTDKTALIVTAQMLLHELQKDNGSDINISNKVSVIHPGLKLTNVKDDVPASPAEEKSIPVQEPAPIVPTPPVKIEKAPENKEPVKPFMAEPKIEELPTFTYQQKELYELNESMSSGSEQTLNDRLKTEKKELGSMLKDSPVKDLKKAIGINDRFVFIDELFRGDENMYERSIKTINGFTIFPEAEYWIQRELKTKIGWDEESPTVKHFDQLVRRRFS